MKNLNLSFYRTKTGEYEIELSFAFEEIIVVIARLKTEKEAKAFIKSIKLVKNYKLYAVEVD